MSKRLVVTDHAFRNVEPEERAAHEVGATFACYACSDEAETAAALTDVDVALVNFAPITRTVLARMRPGATVIRYGIGYDNVDLEGAAELGIQVANVPDYGVQTVADHAAASLLALSRHIPEYHHRIATEGWVRPADIGTIRGFRSSTVGLVGMGRIAQAVHARLVPFGFSFVGYDPYCPPETFARLGVEQVALLDLAARAHAISLHAPSTPETYRIVDAEFLDRLRPGTVLVNTARGPLVDEAALAYAIAAGRVAAAALDVTDPEPIPADSPLRQLPTVILTPHAAFYDEDSVNLLQQLARDEALRALRGEPLRCRIA
ncbi:MAG: C-terminal binding protein [Streptosporangiales bacterium]|nr:C-terminal binding protein [Streptosporangiales bacterium]